jgi:N-terminal half of MaoC dehydratase
MTEKTSLVTQEMVECKGVWGNEEVSYPIGESDIRRWAIATYWPKTPPRLFWDADYAKATKFGGIVAPEDFNPFAWAVPTGEEGALPFNLPGLIGGMILNGGTEDTFFARMRPGDVISSKLRLASWEERELRSGLKLFSKYETEWHNQNGDLIKRRVGTTIQY